MQLVERYQELIERDTNDISILWKLLQMLFYLVSAVAGYVTTYAFYMFQEILSQRCILWAIPSFGQYHFDIFSRRLANDTLYFTEKPWQDRLNIISRSELHCDAILMISMMSCACGVIGFSFFLICGRGGHQVRMYSAPWRLVVPAIVLNFCLSLMSLETAYDFKYGFENFQHSLNKLLNKSGIEPVMEFLQSRIEDSNYELLWKYLRITKISSWTGAIAWVAGFVLLILRVVNITDFRLLRVSIYAPKPRTNELQTEPPQNEPREP